MPREIKIFPTFPTRCHCSFVSSVLLDRPAGSTPPKLQNMCGIFFYIFYSSIAFKRVHFHCFLLCFRFGATRSTSLHTEGDEFHCYASCDARLEQPRCYSRSRNAANSISRFACRQEIREYCYRRLHWIIIREKRSVTMNKLAVKKSST